jgi:hypothetical protein
LLEYHFVELSKFDKDKPSMLRNKFEKWLHILKFGDYYRSKAQTHQAPQKIADPSNTQFS